MRALVTGATGFIGHHLVRRLVAMGDEVRCLVRPTSKIDDLRALGVTFVEGDVTRPDSLGAAVSDVEVVYHLAGAIRAAGNAALWRINEGGTQNVAEACAACPTPPVLLLVSSVAASGPSDGERARVEADPPAPVSDYGRSKLAGETAARALAGRVPTTIVRPPVVFGEGDRETLDLFRMAAKGWQVVPGAGNDRVSLCHAADLAQVLVRAAEKGERLGPETPGHGVYFAGDAHAPTFGELGKLLAAAAGQKKLRVIPTPMAVTWGVAALAELAARVRGTPTLLGLDKAREATAGAWHVSSEKACTQLDLKLGVTLEARLKQTADWYREEGWI